MSAVEPVPITLLVDDSCPLVHVFRAHWIDVHKEPPLTADGRALAEVIPNSFLDRFCDVVERQGIKGKFSIVPMPGGQGDVVRGITGFDAEETHAWLRIAQTRLGASFDFTPEGLTHNLTVDLAGGGMLAIGENEWSQTQDRRTLLPYLTRQLKLLKEAGIDANGFTSPWVFGLQVEAELLVSMAEAQQAVYGRDFTWYYLHGWEQFPSSRPHVAYARDGSTVVSINSTTRDVLWHTIDTPRTDAAYVSALADELLTADGTGGDIAQVLEAGGWPVLVTHWQSLFSNGLETGLAVLEEVGKRVRAALGERVEWMTCLEVATRTADCSRVADATGN